MLGRDGTREIGILLYPGAQLAAVHGLTDLFGIASRLSSGSRGEAGASLRVTHWSPDEERVACVYRTEPAAVPRPGIMIVPPTLTELPAPATCATIERWLLGQHARGVGLVTVCSGVFLIAGTGLLDGRIASTHHSCAQALIDGFPKIAVDVGERVIEHPDILTAGGFMAWVDVGLILIERLLGDAVRSETARFVLAGHGGVAARHFAGTTPCQAHGDAAVQKAQELVHLRDGHGVSLTAMAAAARLERRTFLRRFASATGKTPIEYCRAVRIARARELLEGSKLPLKSVAEALGYGDVSAFAKAFRRAYGVPPGTHRRGHGGAIAAGSANAAAAADG